MLTSASNDKETGSSSSTNIEDNNSNNNNNSDQKNVDEARVVEMFELVLGDAVKARVQNLPVAKE
jgi:hypothetical protein